MKSYRWTFLSRPRSRQRGHGDSASKVALTGHGRVAEESDFNATKGLKGAVTHGSQQLGHNATRGRLRYTMGNDRQVLPGPSWWQYVRDAARNLQNDANIRGGARSSVKTHRRLARRGSGVRVDPGHEDRTLSKVRPASGGFFVGKDSRSSGTWRGKYKTWIFKPLHHPFSPSPPPPTKSDS